MEEYALLRDGREAFAEILRRCDMARRSIFINMFIWRDDDIGTRLAQALLRAAERGVEIEIDKDRCGGIFERAEETGQSFFHKEADPRSALAALGLRLTIPRRNRARLCRQRHSAALSALLAHPRVSLRSGSFKFDHTKYYIFDGETLIFGGINVEDKEITADITGAVYRDFMALISSAAEVEYFRGRISGALPLDPARENDYILNRDTPQGREFGVPEGYLGMIDGAARSADIMMPYIGDRRITAALLRAAERGVAVTLLLPRRANLQQNLNMLTAARLLRQSGGAVRLFLSPLMCHSKLMITDGSLLTVGSANMNRNGMAQCRELNGYSRRPELVEAATAAFRETLAGAERCLAPEYSPLRARLEGLFEM